MLGVTFKAVSHAYGEIDLSTPQLSVPHVCTFWKQWAAARGALGSGALHTVSFQRDHACGRSIREYDGIVRTALWRGDRGVHSDRGADGQGRVVWNSGTFHSRVATCAIIPASRETLWPETLARDDTVG